MANGNVLIVMGSDSDLPVMKAAAKALKEFDINWEMRVASAHRTPEKARELAVTARENGFDAIVAGAGHAAHLGGVLAAHTTLPVIGVPIDSSALSGFDSILSTLQMPPGIPVATMAVGKSGARNAGIFCAQVLAGQYPDLVGKLAAFKESLAQSVEKKDRNLDRTLD